MNYATIKYCDIANGEGVRTSLFVSGCRRHCPNCFNAVAWDFGYGAPFTKEVRDNAFIADLKAKLAEKGATLAVIWVETSPDVVHQRMIERNSDRDTWKLAHWDEYISRCNFSLPENLADPQHMDNLIFFKNNNDAEFETSMQSCVQILQSDAEK